MAMVRQISSLRNIPKDVWNALVPERLPFLRWEWLTAFEVGKVVGPDTDFVPVHALLLEGDEVIAAAPFYLKYTSHAEWTESMFYERLLSQVGFDQIQRTVGLIPFTPVPHWTVLTHPRVNRVQAIEALLRGRLAEERSLLLQCSHIDSEDDALRSVFTNLGFHHEPSYSYRWFRRDATSWEEYLSRFQSRRRSKIRRELESVTTQGISFRWISKNDLHGNAADLAVRAYRANQEKHYGVTGDLTPEFFQHLIHEASSWIRILVAEKENRILGVNVFVESPTGLFGRWWGAFQDVPDLHFAACYHVPIQAAIAERKEFIDPGFQGDFKRWRGFEEISLDSYVLPLVNTKPR